MDRWTDASEWLNNPLTHLVKTGGALRAPANAALTPLSALIPTQANGVRVEYDLTYDVQGRWIKGYKFTDLLTTMVWLAPCHSAMTYETLEALLCQGPTEEGYRVAAQLAAHLSDKYLTKTLRIAAPEQLAVLPGSNVLNSGMVDFAKLDHAVTQGALVKPHPVTNSLDLFRLKARYGPSKVLDPVAKLYPLLRKAQTLYTATNSESGLAGVLWGLDIRLLNGTSSVLPTYHVIYKLLFHAESPLTPHERLVVLLSHAASGLVSVFHERPAKRIEDFFNYYASMSHVPPDEEAP